jgi:hypothetical protein
MFDFALGELGTCDFTRERAPAQSATAARVTCMRGLPWRRAPWHSLQTPPLLPLLTHAVFDWKPAFIPVVTDKVFKAGTFMAWCTLDG